MFRVYGKPPSSEFIGLKANLPFYSPPFDPGHIHIFGTESKSLKVQWHDGTISEIQQVVPNFLSHFRNRIINGDFQIWQRGTSKTGITSPGYYTADRWQIWVNSNSGASFDEQRGFLEYQTPSKKVTVNTPPSSSGLDIVAPFYYIFEGQHLYDLAIKQATVTLSFYFRSNVTGYFTVAIRNRTGGQVDRSYVTEFLYSTPDILKKVEITFPLWYAGMPISNDNQVGFDLIIAGYGENSVTSTFDTWQSGSFWISSNAVNWTAQAGNYVEIGMVQLEEGDRATEFEYVPFEVQLMRCMRYYEKSYPYDVLPGTATWLGLHGMEVPAEGTNVIIPNTVVFRVPKRATPSIVTYSGISGNAGVVVVNAVDRPATIQYVSHVGFRATWMEFTSPKRWLYHQWTADAEL